MSDIRKASQEAVEAAQQSDRYAEILAVVAAMQAAQQQPKPAAPLVPIRQPSQTGKWIAVGVGGSVLLLTVAVSAVAVAIASVAIAMSSLVLWRIYQETFRDKD